MGEETVAVKIPREIFEKIEKEYVKEGEFKSVEEFVTFTLRELLSEESEPVYTPEEEEKIKERLRSLGYL